MTGAEPSATYDSEPVAILRDRFGVPELHAYARAGSTMDLAHAAATRGAPAGTVVVADVQTGGRGRNGRRWTSEAGAGVWATVIERSPGVDALRVLSLRVGLALADRLEPLAGAPLRLKWPNDVLLDGRKLAGILVEARWRGGMADWLAIGVGVNLRPPPDVPTAAGLGAGTRRTEVLGAVIAAVRAAVWPAGLLREAELARYATRDAGRGRRVLAPVAGVAAGVSRTGGLLVAPDGALAIEVHSAAVTWADPLGPGWRELSR